MDGELRAMKYPAVIDGSKGAYGGVVPDILGACAMGNTVDEALANAEDVLADFVSILAEDGKPIPPPSSIDDIPLQPGEIVAYVTLKRPVTA